MTATTLLDLALVGFLGGWLVSGLIQAFYNRPSKSAPEDK